MCTKILTWVFFLLSIFSSAVSDPRTTQASLYCGSRKPGQNPSFIPTFVKEMEGLSQQVSTHHWGTQFVNSTTPMYGLAQCFNDLSHTDCLLCYAASRTKIPRCLPSLAATIFLDGCFLRYDSYRFYRQSTDPSRDTVVCGPSKQDKIEKGEFGRNVGFAIGNATAAAAGNGGFGVAEVKGSVFALAQCWKTLGSAGCKSCLEKGSKAAMGCAPSKEGRALNAGCYLRYSTEKFYNDAGGAEQVADHGHGLSVSRGIIIALILAAAAFLLLSLSGAYACYAKLARIKQERSNVGLAATSINKYSSLKFRYETLEKATDYFNSSRKIGQGGGGSVFKGTLPSGETVAVKRLIYNTRQWVDEFFNEVNLISGIQHKHLVKLLGCSIEGPESLLVYEYVPNRSLDHFLFDKNKVQILNWKERFEIIVGTAEGLAYLHEGCAVRIIHRDIKSSNVLLDENLSPKIADFGLVRCFASEQSHISTGIAGTFGYMAPEYLIQGQLTEKADVYSFGVLVLEIVSGQRNSTFRSESDPDSLLHRVWKLYRSNDLAKVVDPCLGEDFPAGDASNVLRIGLLCTQASVALRPSMAEVVEMLTDREIMAAVPSPKQPPFLNSTTIEPVSTRFRSYSATSSMSNALTKPEASYTSTESSGTRSSDGNSRTQELSQKK
ncbi:hypothetical protein ACFX2J_023251 [Malus domestica]|uniref:cysteine-rich receptor-like protein kinase 42 n=1 Tax=Malus domestica TaxID=3750 RepID=UPI003976A950